MVYSSGHDPPHRHRDRDQERPRAAAAIVERALTVMDAEGPDAVTIRRIAQEFGVTPMALYWHVANKDELLAAMGDALLADVDAAARRPAPWSVQLRGVVEALIDAARAGTPRRPSWSSPASWSPSRACGSRSSR